MITKDQIHQYAKLLQTNKVTAFREYLQYIFLSVLYQHKTSSRVFFKGDTAIHIIYKAPRFSENLDFSTQVKDSDFSKLMSDTFSRLTKSEQLSFKERKTIAGKRYQLNTTNLPSYPPVFINLDFSFREKVQRPQSSIIETPLPIVFTEFVFHESKEEVFAEKIRAVMTRKKGRDLYDLWYLSTLGVKPDMRLVTDKLTYYHLSPISTLEILARCQAFPQNAFLQDVRPFVPIPERTKLLEFYTYIQTYLKQTLHDA